MKTSLRAPKKICIKCPALAVLKVIRIGSAETSYLSGVPPSFPYRKNVKDSSQYDVISTERGMAR